MMPAEGGASHRPCLRREQWRGARRGRWQDAAGAGRTLLDDGPGRALRAVTRKRHVASYGRWLGFLARKSWLDPAAEPGERATPGRIQAYIVELQSLNAPATVLVRLQSLAVV